MAADMEASLGDFDLADRGRPATSETTGFEQGTWFRRILLLGFLVVLALEAWLMWQASQVLF